MKSKAMNVVAGRDRATPAWVRHDADEPLAPISPCYCTRAARPARRRRRGRRGGEGISQGEIVF
jgi:hypothetical protein